MTDRRIDWMRWLARDYTKDEFDAACVEVRRICGALASPDDVQLDIVPHAGGFAVWGHWSEPTSTVEIPAHPEVA